ncbi:MAG: cupin domain-containing protein, partial [Magnetococcales bacterium]|nr:cupin domain-containing protein [Magnetococcales bacterium]
MDTRPIYITKDGSEIVELLHPDHDGPGAQSLAQARIPPGGRTFKHHHNLTEALYHFTSGKGIMELGGRRFPVATGETVRIPPGTPHCLENSSSKEHLTLLCCCA